MVGCKIGAIRLHDVAAFILAKLVRSLLVDATVDPLRLFSGAGAETAYQRSDILLRDPRGFGRQVIVDVAVAAVDGQFRASDEATGRPLNVRHEQKIAECHRVADAPACDIWTQSHISYP